MPQRFQRSRVAGWRMPEGSVYVGRPTRWGNPFKAGDPHPETHRPIRDAAEAAFLFDLHVGPMGLHEIDPAEVRRELGGKDLACWCPLDQPCHADVLLSIANEEN